jgi:molybdopterin molybdotransferase
MIAAEGGRTIDCGVVPDRAARIARTLARALRAADLVLISGGSSVGTRDLTPAVIKTMPRARIMVHGIRIKPGKPTILARAAGTPILGLPGHPVSALVIFELFGAALIRLLGGEPPAQAFTPRHRTVARLGTAIASKAGREDYVRVTVRDEDGSLVARPLGGGSADIFSLVNADGMVRVDADASELPAGTIVPVHLFG